MLSPRVRRLKAEFGDALEIHHRCFALAPSQAHITQMFGSPEAAKREVLTHWEAANRHDDERRIRADLMASRPFPYPHSMPGLLACKAAEQQGGAAAHWDCFDRVQRAHLTECRNIADADVLLDVAHELGLDVARFAADMQSAAVRQAVGADCAEAATHGIRAVPTLVVGDRRLLQGAVSYQELTTAVRQALART